MNEQHALTKTPTDRAVEYVPFGAADKIKLTVAIVQNLIAVPTRSKKTCSERDAMKFIMLCQAQRLNPFAGDAYLVGYDGADGPSFSLITAHQAFLKRAEVNPEYDGMTSGIILVTEDGEVIEREGDFHLPSESQQVVGGWARVFHKQRSHPTVRKIRMARFNKGFAQWKEDAAGMIVKCAEADALRSTFPTMLGGLYIQDEISTNAIEVSSSKPVTVETPQIAAPAEPDKPVARRGRPRKLDPSSSGEAPQASTFGTTEPGPSDPPADPEDDIPEQPKVGPRSIKADCIDALRENGVSVDDFTDYLITKNIHRDAKSAADFEDLPAVVYDAVVGDPLAKIIKLYGEGK